MAVTCGRKNIFSNIGASLERSVAEKNAPLWRKQKNRLLSYCMRVHGVTVLRKQNENSSHGTRDSNIIVLWCTWVAQSVKHLPSAQVRISGSWDGAHIRLPTQQGLCFSLSLCLPPQLVFSLSLSLSQINKPILKIFKRNIFIYFSVIKKNLVNIYR